MPAAPVTLVEADRRCVWVPGTWGELVQGVRPNGQRVLVSLPSKRGAWVHGRVVLRRAGEPPVCVPPGHSKAARAVVLLMQRLDVRDAQLLLGFHSCLSRGVGHASSSADVLGALRLAGRLLGRSLSSATLCELASTVEATNPVLVPGACLFEPDAGQVLGQAPMPPLRGIPLQWGAGRETKGRGQASWSPSARRRFERILCTLLEGLEHCDPVRVIQASTASALLLAEREQRTDVVACLERARALGAAGISASHSGTGVVALFPGR
ncbi:MAG: hypothetical protein ACI9VR_002235 [Cognaticolwellia sp.]|jgi:uncharacterized protein involved in propanediol utilization